jgi:hippurate hydrolase
VVNPPEAVAWARQAVTASLGADALVPLGLLNLAAEDFAWYLEKMTGCFLRIGARESNGLPIPAHTSRFYAADEAIFVGAAVLAETARVASAALATTSSRPSRTPWRQGGTAVRQPAKRAPRARAKRPKKAR